MSFAAEIAALATPVLKALCFVGTPSVKTITVFRRPSSSLELFIRFCASSIPAPTFVAPEGVSVKPLILLISVASPSLSTAVHSASVFASSLKVTIAMWWLASLLYLAATSPIKLLTAFFIALWRVPSLNLSSIEPDWSSTSTISIGLTLVVSTSLPIACAVIRMV